MIQWMLAIWSLVPLPFLNPAWTSGNFQITCYWSLAWRIFSITLLACEMSAIIRQFEHSLALPFFGIGMKTDLFQSCGHCWVFQICWRIECSTLTKLSGPSYEVVICWRRWSEASTLFCLWGRFELLSSNLNPWGNCVFLGMEYMPQAVSLLWQWLWISCLFSSLSSGVFVCMCVCERERETERQR